MVPVTLEPGFGVVRSRTWSFPTSGRAPVQRAAAVRSAVIAAKDLSVSGYGRFMATAYAVVYTRAPGSDWPMDIGDDPAMMAATMPGPGVITWGICRRAERNRVARGDLIVFFAADRLSDRKPARYCWVGYATVDWKVTQADIWTSGELSGLRKYPNLLIRASPTGYVHCEEWHADWIWRLTDMPGVSKAEFAVLEATDVLQADSEVQGRPVEFASNYVIFMPEGAGTFVAAEPPVVAHAHAKDEPEIWEQTAIATEFYNLTLGSGATRPRLRIRGTQEPHTPPTRLLTEASEVRAALDLLVQRQGLRNRDAASS
jgi:hypothetical protein